LNPSHHFIVHDVNSKNVFIFQNFQFIVQVL